MFINKSKNSIVILVLICSLLIAMQSGAPLYFDHTYLYGYNKKFKIIKKTMSLNKMKKLIVEKYKKRMLFKKKLFRFFIISIIILIFLENYGYVSFSSSLIFISANISTDERIEIYSHEDIQTVYFAKPFHLSFKKKSLLAKLFVILMKKAVFAPVENHNKNLSNETLASCTGFSKNWISKLIKRFDIFGLIGLERIPNGGYLSKKAVTRVFTLIAENINLSPKKISKILVEEKLCEKENISAVCNVLANCNLIELLPYLRGQITGETENKAIRILLEQALSLLDEILPLINNPESFKSDFEEIIKAFQYQEEKIGLPKNWDQKNVKKSTKKRQAQKQNKLLDLLHFKKPLTRCPKCKSTNVKLKQEYKRKYQNAEGLFESNTCRHYICNEPLCNEGFTVSPEDIESYVRSVRKIQVFALNQLLDAGVSLRRIASNSIKGIDGIVKVSHTTILNWIEIIADTLPKFTEVFGVRCSGKISIDEKYVKLRGQWHYVFIAVDIASLDVIHIDIFTTRTKESAEVFLKAIRAMDYKIDVIITDGCNIYDKSIPKVYKDAKHLHCVLHLGRSAHNRLVQALDSPKKEDKEYLSQLLSNIYKAKKKGEFNKAWSEWEKGIKKMQKKYPELEKFHHELLEEKNEIKRRVLDKKQLRTSNAAEHVIGEFDRKYENMQSFMSFYHAQAWCKLFQVYYRLHKFERGKRKGKSPAEIAGHNVKDIDYIDFMLPGEELNIVERNRKEEARETSKLVL